MTGPMGKGPLWLVLCAFLGCGCASVPDPGGPEILVTFPVQDFSEPTFGGSSRAYHAGSAWQSTLHTRQLVRRFARDYELIPADAWPIESLGVYCVAFRAIEPVGIRTLLERVGADPRVSLAQPNQQFVGMTAAAGGYDDPLFDLQYGEFRAALEKLHRVSLGRGVRVGVIDSNVDARHPDLRGQVAKQVELTPSHGVEDRVHGTAVTGVIAAAAGNGEGLVGLAPEALIHVFGACAKQEGRTLCNSFSLAKALAYAIEDDIDVLNMSLAGPDDAILSALIGRAVAEGMIIIAADNPSRPELRFPASLPEVHSAQDDSVLWFARGEQLSTHAGGGYQVFFGSSVASAGLTGLAALLRAETSAARTNDILRWLLGDDCTRQQTPDVTGFDPHWLCER